MGEEVLTLIIIAFFQTMWLFVLCLKAMTLLLAACFTAWCTMELPEQGMQSHTVQDMGGTKAFFSDYLNMCCSNIKSL